MLTLTRNTRWESISDNTAHAVHQPRTARPRIGAVLIVIVMMTTITTVRTEKEADAFPWRCVLGGLLPCVPVDAGGSTWVGVEIAATGSGAIIYGGQYGGATLAAASVAGAPLVVVGVGMAVYGTVSIINQCNNVKSDVGATLGAYAGAYAANHFVAQPTRTK